MSRESENLVISGNIDLAALFGLISDPKEPGLGEIDCNATLDALIAHLKSHGADVGSEFGTKVVPPERLVKMLPQLFDHHDQNVRSSSKCLMFELCCWIGEDSVKSILFQNMKDTKIKELEADLAQATGTTNPTPKIRLEREKEPDPDDVTETTGDGPAEELESESVASTEISGDGSAKESIPDAEVRGDISRSVADPVFARESHVHPGVHIERNTLPRVHAGIHGPIDWNEVLDAIAYGGPEQAIEGMKAVYRHVERATDAPDVSAMIDILKVVDQLVSVLTNKATSNFDCILIGASWKSCEYVFDTLLRIFCSKTLGHAIQETTLNTLITELLLWVSDERVRIYVGDQIVKDLSPLMLTILANAVQTSSFVVFINLLRPVESSRRPASASDGAISVESQRFSNLVVECLNKLTRFLKSTIQDVDLDRILESIHVYLQYLGLEEIMRRTKTDDKPLRAVKYILHELVQLRGLAVKEHLSKVPIDKEPKPIILRFIDLFLQMPTPSRPVSQARQLNGAASSVPSSAPSNNEHTLTRPVDQDQKLNGGAASSVPSLTSPQASSFRPQPKLVPFPVISNSLCDANSHHRRVKPLAIRLRPQRSG